jgi:isoleucyl-tRNA synthetase
MWRGITGGRSVHLEMWPEAAEFKADDQLVKDMDTIREAASVALSLRKAAGLRVRLPLQELVIAAENSKTLGAYADLIADELNVKNIRVVEATEQVASEFGLTKSLSVNARTLGPRVGGDVQRIIKASKAGNWKLIAGEVEVDGTVLLEGEYEITMVAAGDSELQRVGVTDSGFVLLNTVITPELEKEGIARDAVRLIQQARKDAGLEVSDRIFLTLTSDQETIAAFTEHREFIATETLATKFELRVGSVSAHLTVGEGFGIAIELEKN